ncbi:ROK family protein [Mesorhizobium sp. BAC0120]|uniref:ROK family protein n=1 Tax=Mesorhizobium sp. BAC0120 TaxID=3090670 RepID=UPI00298C80B5|nr:ROK family protein [Mesorhizobium sp. BAC0120]MDW6023055.1 ROK family protein [Mesorhizobium sp. BAC0120]
MSAAIAELEELGYVEMVGAIQGPLGRSAAQYKVGSGAGHVIAVDAGATHLRLRACALDRRQLANRVLRLPTSQLTINEEISRAVASEFSIIRSMADQSWGPLRAIGLAVPTRVVGPGGDVVGSRQEIVFSAFSPPRGVTLILENNVNCAAIAERHYGAARGVSSFAYVQIGLKIGMGLVLNDQLVRGRNGAAGEIGHLSFPFAPGAEPLPGEAEHYLGNEAFIARVRSDWPASAGPAPGDTAELLALAETGHADAVRHVASHASDIGAIIATCVSVVDPGLVVLGGGLGASPLLLPVVRETASRLSYPVDIQNTLLGPDATVLGIERLAIDATLRQLLDGEA